MRAARAAIFLMGDSGLRRRHPSAADPGQTKSAVWTSSIIGKRRNQRTVPVSGAKDFDAPHAHGPLIAPQWVPATRAALERHDGDANEAP